MQPHPITTLVFFFFSQHNGEGGAKVKLEHFTFFGKALDPHLSKKTKVHTQTTPIRSLPTLGVLWKNIERAGVSSTLASHLQQGAGLRVPTRAGPRTQQGQADLAVVVEVGIEPDSPVASGEEVHLRWTVWVVRREQKVELEAAALPQGNSNSTNNKRKTGGVG